MFGLHPQSTRSRQGEQRNPEVELEVRLAVSVPHFCIYVFPLKICRTQSHRLNTNSVSSFYSLLSVCLSERATRMTFLESGMFSPAIIVIEKNNQRRQINSKNRLFLGGQKLNLKKRLNIKPMSSLLFVGTEGLFSCAGGFEVHMWRIQDSTVC